MKKTRLTVYTIYISLLLYTAGCNGSNPPPCPSPFEYTTANFTIHNLTEDSIEEAHASSIGSDKWIPPFDSFPAGTDIICRAVDPRMTTYEWSVQPGYSLWRDTIYDQVILNNKDNKIIVKYDDVVQYLCPENNYSILLILRATRPPHICKGCDTGYGIKLMSITYTGLSTDNNVTKTDSTIPATDSTNISR